jgi:uncharacterized secreted protein with C-terminal beta-propeller domain
MDGEAGPTPAQSDRPLRAPAQRRRSFALGGGFVAAVAALVVGAVLAGGTTGHGTPALPQPSTPGPSTSVPSTPGDPPTGGRPVGPIELVAYDTCDAMRADLRAHTANSVTPYGLPGNRYGYRLTPVDGSMKGSVSAPAAASGAEAAPDHSTTNVQEPGVGEPDTIDTDGRRVVSVSDGVLRVVDARTHKLTGRLDLTMYANANSAQLLLSGDRALVILGEASPGYYGGPIYSQPAGPSSDQSSLFLLVDLTGTTPSVISTLHPHGGYVDARMVDGTARLVVRSAPTVAFPVPTPAQTEPATDAQRLARNRDIVARAPLSAWLPTYEVTDGAATTAYTVPCTQVSHPKTYTGASMLTVYTVNLAVGLDQPEPVTIAADGTTVYGSTTSLYVASSNGNQTQLHRFDTSTAGRPTYLGSGNVPGQLLDSYSMSEYQNSLRVVTTSYQSQRSTSLYVLDASSLRRRGAVHGLGVGEQLHAVRFLGPLAYVVTFRSVDPLFVIDLHDPTRPRRAGALTVTGYSDYLHPVGAGRLLGVGESVNSAGIVDGLQISLFDSTSPQHPKRIGRITRPNTPSESPIDPHAFLYWAPANLAVVPINSWNGNESGAALVVRVGPIGVHTMGTIRNPAESTTNNYDSGISRTLVIGSDIWTMSSSGLRVSDLNTLERRAWVPFL